MWISCHRYSVGMEAEMSIKQSEKLSLMLETFHFVTSSHMHHFQKYIVCQTRTGETLKNRLLKDIKYFAKPWGNSH